MSRVDSAAAMDRLPWLPDEPQVKPAQPRRSNVAFWAAGAITAVAAAGFWIGENSVRQPQPTPLRPAPSTTVRLPEPRRAAPAEVRMPPQSEVRQAPVPQVRPAPVREVKIFAPKSAAHESDESGASVQKPVDEARSAAVLPAAPAAPAPRPAAQFAVPRPWPARVVAGAAGRLVQIGAFGSTHQAKRGWWFMVRAYPAVAHLPAVVTVSRNSRGRAFYRFQVGTTSQAHSEVLCQRMETIRLSCAVVGLPWKAKVER